MTPAPIFSWIYFITHSRSFETVAECLYHFISDMFKDNDNKDRVRAIEAQYLGAKNSINKTSLKESCIDRCWQENTVSNIKIFTLKPLKLTVLKLNWLTIQKLFLFPPENIWPKCKRFIKPSSAFNVFSAKEKSSNNWLIDFQWKKFVSKVSPVDLFLDPLNNIDELLSSWAALYHVITSQ